MQSIAYTAAPRQDDRRPSLTNGHHVSLNKLGVVLASFALWAAMIGGMALVAG